MTLAEAEHALSVRPVGLTAEQGCVLVADDLTPRPWTLAAHLERYSDDVARVERTVNRRFVVAHLLDGLMARPLSYASGTMTPEAFDAIVRVAVSYAARVQDALRASYPDQRFDVEVVGADYVDEEPLEVCVTFSQSL